MQFVCREVTDQQWYGMEGISLYVRFRCVFLHRAIREVILKKADLISEAVTVQINSLSLKTKSQFSVFSLKSPILFEIWYLKIFSDRYTLAPVNFGLVSVW